MAECQIMKTASTNPVGVSSVGPNKVVRCYTACLVPNPGGSRFAILRFVIARGNL